MVDKETSRLRTLWTVVIAIVTVILFMLTIAGQGPGPVGGDPQESENSAPAPSDGKPAAVHPLR